ncbi:hypothetical protein ACFWPK_04365 [Nocardia sp. NPDC058519]|uniref:hypothetical protein n=1 Tax=Nocardia sp. NPDC058519 TaxID=3346535 RepID=UPI00365566D0
MKYVSAVAEILGLAVVAAGLGMLAGWLGVIFAGLALVAVGVALDPPQRSSRGGAR